MNVDPFTCSNNAELRRGSTSEAVRGLVWAPGRDKLWLGVDVSQSGVVKEWDLDDGGCKETMRVSLGAPVVNVHQLSTHVVLAEV